MNKLLFTRNGMFSIRRLFSTPSTDANQSASSSIAPKYKPSEFQKFILVWTKKYKSKAEVPTHVSPDLLERARSEARIKISNILIGLTILASLGAVIAGKSAAKRGESVQQMNLDWHKKYDEEYKKNEEAKK